MLINQFAVDILVLMVHFEFYVIFFSMSLQCESRQKIEIGVLFPCLPTWISGFGSGYVPHWLYICFLSLP